MICVNCQCEHDKLRGRGMCSTCYARWRRADDRSGFVTISRDDIASALRQGCLNGDVKDLIEEGKTFIEIAGIYGVGRVTVSRYVDEYGLRSKAKRKQITFADKTQCIVEAAGAKLLALYSPWKLTA